MSKGYKEAVEKVLRRHGDLLKRLDDKTPSKWDVLHSSKKEDWATPQALFDGLNRRYGPFDLDAAASAENTKCKLYYDGSGNLYDGLVEPWAKRTYLNPPYGRKIGDWLRKAYEESQKGCRVVCLVPSRTGSRWFLNAATRASEILFVVGRITFSGAPSPAPFDSAVIVFEPGHINLNGANATARWITREELYGEKD